MTISIKGLDKADVLAALFNGTQVLGMGFLQAGRGPSVMTKADAEKVINSGQQDNMPPAGALTNRRELYYDYLYGRPLKVDITEDTFEERLYDRDAGHGQARRVINTLRKQVGVPEPEGEVEA